MTPQARPGTEPAAADGLESPLEREMPTMSMRIRPKEGVDQLTIGVVIDIPEPWAAHLQQWRHEFGDPMARSIPTHVTLLPPTPVTASGYDEVAAHLTDVALRARPFALRLSGTDTFRPVSPVVFVKVAEGAPGCDALQQQVRTGPLVRDLAFPYHPHVTIAHDVDEASLDRAQHTLAEFDVLFTVTSMGLYEHGADGVWRRRRRLMFGARGA